MGARLRYFTVIGDPIGFLYLHAIAESPHGVTMAPIGPAFLMMPPWNQCAHLFGKPVAPLEEIVNIVCAPRGLLMGAKFGDYEPQTAFEGLYTDKVPNVAIVAPGGTGDVETLAQYDLVVEGPGGVKPEGFLRAIEALLPLKAERHTERDVDARITKEIYHGAR